ncbi:MAG: YqaE/Pmp3 family membrane protein [Bacteroidia bacterium]
MKTINLKTLAAGLVAGMLLVSSCSVEKRHYLSGYAVQWKDGKNKHVATHTNETKPAEKVQPALVSSLITTKANETPKDIELLASTKSMVFAKPEKASSFQSQLSQHNPQASKHIKLKTKVKEEHLNFLEKEKITNQKSSGGDTNLIIEIILCFFPFFNLIAMYLKDGKRITLNFWIDLILDCLFFFPGIIFALLVVLDVVNLA